MTNFPLELRLNRSALAVSGVALVLTATSLLAPAWIFVCVGLGFAVAAPIGLAVYRRPADRTRAVAAELEAYAGLTEVVRSQLAGVNAEMSTAVLLLIEQLQQIDGGVASILAAVEECARKSDGLVSCSKEDVATKLAQLDAAANRLTRDVLRDDDQRCVVLADMQRALRSIDEIRTIADATRRLAADAAAQAAQAGDAGRSFGIVASEVQTHSLRSIALAQRVGTDLQTALDAIDRYHFDIRARSQIDRQEFQAALGGEFAALTDRLTQLMQTQTNAAQQVARRGEEVAAQVVAVLANLQFQDVTRQQVDHAIEALARFECHNEDIRQFLLGVDAAQNAPTIQPLMDDMYARYVMERQRTIHTAALTHDEPEARVAQPAIELF